MAMKRFRVAGHSMSPTLQPGQEVVAVDTRTAEPGNLVVFEHPQRPNSWLIKRLADETGWVRSDNPDDSDFDSEQLGALPIPALLPVVERFDETTFKEACILLMAEDSSLRHLVERWGLPDFWNRRPGFETLALLVLEQQVSLESGAAMYRRLAGLIGHVTPENVTAAGEHRLRSIGVTRQKTTYLLDLAQRIIDGILDLDRLETQSITEARSVLLAVRGIGPWTADAYLLSASRRPDMWPVGDRALQVGVGETLGTSSTPTADELESIGEPWRPIRAAAARMIWHGYLSKRGRVEPPDPTLVHLSEPSA